jgi:hypothetical protein
MATLYGFWKTTAFIVEGTDMVTVLVIASNRCSAGGCWRAGNGRNVYG